MNRTRSIIIALVIGIAMLILLWFKETNPPLTDPVETLTPLEDDIIFQEGTYLNEYPLQSLIDNMETLPYIYCPTNTPSNNSLIGHVTYINKDGNLILTDYVSAETPTRYETHINNCIFGDQPSTSTNTLGGQVMF